MCIRDRTYIERNVKEKTPFFAVIWFGSPHVPLQAMPEDLKAAGGSAYYGEMLGVDRSMGTLRKGLRRLGIAENTMLWFNSDNGAWMDEKAAPDTYGSNSVLRGHKGELWEGGIRVPGLVEWPARIKPASVTDVPVVTSDIYPTLVDLLKIKMPDQTQPLDGISIMPLLDGQMKARPKPIGFWHPDGDNIMGELSAWNDNRYKLHRLPGNKYELYDLSVDISEKTDIAASNPEIVERMKVEMEAWRQSVIKSNDGNDYPGGLPAQEKPAKE